MWYGQCYKIDVWDDPFVNYDNRQEPYGCFILLWPACCIYIYPCDIYCIDGGQPRWRRHGPWCHAGGMMEIIPWRTRWRSSARRTISYHIIHACDVNPFMHLILLRFDRNGSIIRWSLSHNIKIIMCSSLVCTVTKVRRFETPRDDRVW